MRIIKTLVQPLYKVLIVFTIVNSLTSKMTLAQSEESLFKKSSPYDLFFDPEINGVRVQSQIIDYDLSKQTTLRLGPFFLDQTSVSMHMTREQGEYYDLEFGLELKKKIIPVYVMSFRWPIDFVPKGTIEIIDDKGESLWRRQITDRDLDSWALLIKEQTDKSLLDKNRQNEQTKIKSIDDKEEFERVREELNLARPQNLSRAHHRSHFGLSHKQFFEVPIAQIKKPFRFCISEDKEKSRLAVCSQRYEFSQVAGKFTLKAIAKESSPRVYVNDKLVTERGTAIFLETNIPIKLSALLKNGTYFEFVSNPKLVKLVDIIAAKNGEVAQIVGYGDTPISKVTDSFYADTVHWGLLNFLPTIGDLRKFWTANVDTKVPYLYLKGEGGAPFRQPFSFESLPTTDARITLSTKTTKSTYGSKVWVAGEVNPSIEISADDAKVNRLSPENFEWQFPAPTRGVYNKGFLNIKEKEKTWKAYYEIYRGYPAEIAGRLSGVVTNELELVLLGEISGQYWFENIFGWRNYLFGQQRWGIASRYFRAFLGTDQSLKTLNVGNVDIKYRMTPGIWGRDPTVGLMGSFLNLDYGFEDELGPANYHVPVVGGGVFWARSMPKFFDDIFNVVPYLRYPKWVDWEFVYYPIAIRDKQVSNFMFAMNFHGKIEFTKKFFGEAGFGLKNFSFEDTRSGNQDKHLGLTAVIAYGTLGLGFNF